MKSITIDGSGREKKNKRCQLSNTTKVWKATSPCREIASRTELQPAYQEGINFYEQKPNKKFFKLNPHVENEEKLQRLIFWGVSGLKSCGRPSCAPAAVTPWTRKETGTVPPSFITGAIWKVRGCFSSVWVVTFGFHLAAFQVHTHIENYIPRQWDEVAILNGRRSIYNDFVAIFRGQ